MARELQSLPPMKTTLASVLTLVVLSSIAGCGARDAGDADADASTSDVVGVTDLAELEAAFGLRKDVKVDGQWTRGDDRLHAGPCWQERFANPGHDPSHWELRRYTNGAAFFRKLGVTPEEGDERAVRCVDYDVDSGEGQVETYSLEGMSLDVAFRTKLGVPGSYEGAMGSMYLDFARVAVQVQDAEHLCGLYDLAGQQGSIDPAIKAGADAVAACPRADAPDCQERAYNVCKWVFVANTQDEGTIDFPAFTGGLRFLGTANDDVSASVAAFVYRYAMKNNTDALRFSMAADPVGSFVAHRPGKSEVEDVTVYDRLEVHHVAVNGYTEGLYLTVLNESDPAAHAVASCTRTLAADGQPTTSYACTGL